MSELAKQARARMREKAHRMADGEPHAKLDASGWTPPEPLNTTAKTGMRPVSRQARKRGGKVEGKHEHHRADKRARRASGGRGLVNEFVNRNDKEANESRAGVKHEGGLKKGGRAHKDMGGPLAGAISQGIGGQGRMGFNYPQAQSLAGRLGVRKGGGAKHPDEAEDRKLVERMVKKEARTGKKHGGRDEACGGGAMYRKGGRTSTDGEIQGTRPGGGRLARKHGGHLTAHERQHLPKSDFALPGKGEGPKGAGSGSYPIPDKAHARNALARVAQHGSSEQKAKVRAKVHAKFPDIGEKAHGGAIRRAIESAEWGRGEHREHHAHGGKAGKGKMNVNIVIAPQGHQAPMGAMPPSGPPQAPPKPPVQPLPVPTGMPMGMAPGMGVGMPAGGMPPMGAAGLPPGMMRKRGGRARYDAGAGSGEGRLEKIERYGQ